jgi:UDP-glucose 4-epimerase
MEGALESNCEVFNLGTGKGVTVLELIAAFEKVAGLKLNFEIGPRRPGDVVAIYANSNKALEKLGWKAKYDVEAMMATAWKWEKYLNLCNKAPLN